MWKTALIISFGIGHPVSTGTYEAWTYRPVAIDIINSENDHTWLVASRVFILTGAIASFKWGQQNPSTADVVLTAIGTALIRDAVANTTFQWVKTGNPMARQKIPGLKLGMFDVEFGFETDGRGRVFEALLGTSLLIISEKVN